MLILEGLIAPVARLAFSNDAGAILASGVGTADGWRTAVWRLPGPPEPQHLASGVTEALFAPARDLLISLRLGEDRSATIGCLDLATLAPSGPSRRAIDPEAVPDFVNYLEPTLA